MPQHFSCGLILTKCCVETTGHPYAASINSLMCSAVGQPTNQTVICVRSLQLEQQPLTVRFDLWLPGNVWSSPREQERTGPEEAAAALVSSPPQNSASCSSGQKGLKTCHTEEIYFPTKGHVLYVLFILCYSHDKILLQRGKSV